MEFRIQYFGRYDLLLYGEVVDAETLDDALDRARGIIHERYPSFVDPAIIGYVILDDRGRLVARGYKRGLGERQNGDEAVVPSE
jgi:hypothetical protein